MKKYAIGFDLGGTNMVAAVLSIDGKIMRRKKVPTLAAEDKTKVWARMAGVINDLIRESGVDRGEFLGVGLGSPGLVDRKNGVVFTSPNLPDWENIPLANIIAQEVSLPVYVDNDVNVITLGELFFGAGKGRKNFIYLTLGTGIGGSIVTDGAILRGENGFAGEVGHMTVDPDGPLCGCGNYGCLEALSSATAIVRRFTEGLVKGGQSKILEIIHGDLSRIDTRLICQVAEQGDLLARKTLEEAGIYLGVAIANLVNLLNPEAIIIGGGVSLAGEHIFAPLRRTGSIRAYRQSWQNMELLYSKMVDDAGLYGGLALVLENVNRN
ncbi:MAG: ROK family protein [Bacillota bacterium]